MLKEIVTYILSIPAFYAAFTLFSVASLGMTALALKTRSVFLLQITTFIGHIITSYAAFVSIYIVFSVMRQETTFVMFIIPVVAMISNDWSRIRKAQTLPEDTRGSFTNQRRMALVADILGFVIALFIVPDSWQVWQIHYIPNA